MKRFKVGQIVELVIFGPIAAKPGATAVVVRGSFLEYGFEYIDIEWIRDNFAGLQVDGCYDSISFKLKGPCVGEQLEFAFMN